MNKIDYRTQTTLITGASSGLGAEFARQFAERGSNLVLVARRADRLQVLADELSPKHKVTATVVPFDLGAPAAGQALASGTRRAPSRSSTTTRTDTRMCSPGTASFPAAWATPARTLRPSPV